MTIEDTSTLNMQQMLDLIPTGVYFPKDHDFGWLTICKIYEDDAQNIPAWEICYTDSYGRCYVDWDFIHVDLATSIRQMLTRLIEEKHLN